MTVAAKNTGLISSGAGGFFSGSLQQQHLHSQDTIASSMISDD